MDTTSQKVKVQELKAGMVIQEISELSFEYSSLDTATLDLLKTHFKGANGMVATDSGYRKVPMENLNEFDQVQAITDIPGHLKIAKVEPETIKFLEQHGFMEFLVSIPGGPATQTGSKTGGLEVGSDEAKALHEQKKEEVKQFLETLETASVNRDDSSQSVEEMLDRGRKGEFTTKGAEAAVQEILNTGSSEAMKAIAGLKGSDQTYAHCVDMSVILQECYLDIQKRAKKEVPQNMRRFALLAGFVHDIGKSEVPKEILDSTVRFEPDSREMTIMRNHTTYGARILQDLKMPEAVINVAHYHHVKKDTNLFTSYPDIDYEKVSAVTRLASIVDVYQALIGKRKYKRNWVPGKAIEYLSNLRGTEFDERMLDHFLESMGKYPVGSLLRLNTGDLAFVLRIAPATHPDRPIVVVVENAKGERISSHALLDLMLDPEISVSEVVDHYEHYSASEEEAYQIFESIRIA